MLGAVVRPWVVGAVICIGCGADAHAVDVPSVSAAPVAQGSAPPRQPPAPEPEEEISRSDFEGASGHCYHTVRCVPPPRVLPALPAPPPNDRCPRARWRTEVHRAWTERMSREHARPLCCYRTEACEADF